ncbi:MAG TPA: hypothetical protein VNV66_03510 [Pilimelia sp.]|nr:hypothetical protein [Pilimelia sp.]
MKRHRTDAVSLVFGVIFVAGAVWWLLAQLTDLAPAVLGWLAAGGLILFGLLGLFGALRSRPRPAGGAPAAEPAPAAGSAPPPGADEPAGTGAEPPGAASGSASGRPEPAGADAERGAAG